MPQTDADATSSPQSHQSISPTQVALRAAGALHDGRKGAEATYARLMVKNQLSKSEEKELDAVVRLLNLPQEKVAADARAVERARVLQGIIRQSTSPETEAALQKAVNDVQAHYAQTEIYMKRRQAELEELAMRRHEMESLSFAFNSAGSELAALAKEHPIVNGLSD